MRFLIALLVASVVACSSSTKLPPVAPEDVEVYKSGTLMQSPEGVYYRTPPVPVPEEYVVAWQTAENVEVERQAFTAGREYEGFHKWNTYPNSWTDEQITEDLKEEAAKRGADALLIIRDIQSSLRITF